MTALYLIGAILTEVGATMSLRASEGFAKRIWIIPMTLGYLTAFGLLTLALTEGLALGVAYGIWSASGIALTAVLAQVFFNEPLTRTMTAGIGLIAAGVLIVELGANAAH